MALALTAMLALGAWRVQTAHRASELIEENARLTREWQRYIHGGAARADEDYVGGLGSVARTTPETLAHELQASADGDRSATVVSVNAASVPGTVQSLPRQDIEFILHGDYAHLKAGLTGLLQHHANAVLRHLSLKRQQPAGDQLEAQVALSLVSAPATVSSAPAAVR